MKSFVFISFFLLTAIHAFPQKKISGTVRGTIVDTAGKQDLSQATVSITPVDLDSSDVQFSTTDRKGSFLMKDLKPGTYHLMISFEGYSHIRKNFTISTDNKDVDLKTLYVQPATDLMEEVV